MPLGARLAVLATSNHLVTWPASPCLMVVEPVCWTEHHVVFLIEAGVVHIGALPAVFLTLLTWDEDALLVLPVVVLDGFGKVEPRGDAGAIFRIVEGGLGALSSFNASGEVVVRVTFWGNCDAVKVLKGGITNATPAVARSPPRVASGSHLFRTDFTIGLGAVWWCQTGLLFVNGLGILWQGIPVFGAGSSGWVVEFFSGAVSYLPFSAPSLMGVSLWWMSLAVEELKG